MDLAERMTSIAYQQIGGTPERIGDYLESVGYDYEKADKIIEKTRLSVDPENKDKVKEIEQGLFLRSIMDVIRDRKVICTEGALAALWLLPKEYEATLVSLTKGAGKPGHTICMYKDIETGLYGSFSVSRYSHLRNRSPVYRDEQSLIDSYRCKEFQFTGSRMINDHKDWPSMWGLSRHPFSDN